MTNRFTLTDLTQWIANLIDIAREDTTCDVSWFEGTKDCPFSIVGGWARMFTEDHSDIFCGSKREPGNVMCVEVVINDPASQDLDFDHLQLPLDLDGDFDDTSVPLEWDDNPECAAQFFMGEWERIMKEHGENY